MFSFLLGSVSSLFWWGGHFCLQQYKNYKNRSRFSRVMITNVLSPFYGSQCIMQPHLSILERYDRMFDKTSDYRYIHLCTRLRQVSDRCAVARCVSRRRGNTGRQRHVVPWWCSTTSQWLRLDDLSETELTAALWASTRYVDTCAQPRYVRPVLSPSCCTVHAVRLYIQHIQ